MKTITNQSKTKSAFNGNYIEYQSKGEKDKNLSPKEYLDIISPYLSDMINDHKTQSEWKIQLTLQMTFILHKDSEEARTMYTKSCNIDIFSFFWGWGGGGGGDETDETIRTF